jgi:hypothetical protein
MVTDLTNNLSSDELHLLSKGPKFSISERVNEKVCLDIRSSFCRLAYQLRWKSHIPDVAHSQIEVPPFPRSDLYLTPPPPSPELQLRLSQAFSKISHIIQSEGRKASNRNMTSEEWSILKGLRSKDNIYLPSDKGSEFCVIESPKYNELALDHLNDAAIYRSIQHIAPTTIEKRINTKWINICHNKGIPKHIKQSYVTNNSRIPTFYHLIKTHKTGPTIKIRPIVSNVNSPTYKIAWMLSKILKPLLRYVPSHLENSLQLIERIQQRVPILHKNWVLTPC